VATASKRRRPRSGGFQPPTVETPRSGDFQAPQAKERRFPTADSEKAKLLHRGGTPLPLYQSHPLIVNGITPIIRRLKTATLGVGAPS